MVINIIVVVVICCCYSDYYEINAIGVIKTERKCLQPKTAFSMVM